MIDRTTLLFALPGFRVLNVTLEPDGGRVVLVESSAKEGGCPSCGVMSSRIKDRPVCRLKGLLVFRRGWPRPRSSTKSPFEQVGELRRQLVLTGQALTVLGFAPCKTLAVH